jgi:hypothetical protein
MFVVIRYDVQCAARGWALSHVTEESNAWGRELSVLDSLVRDAGEVYFVRRRQSNGGTIDLMKTLPAKRTLPEEP